MLRKIIKIILIGCWMGVIFSFSNSNGESSASLSDKVVIRIVETVKGEELSVKEQKQWIARIGVFVRKCAHLFIYFILGILIFSFLREFSIRDKQISMILAIFLCFLYACSDELHQLFISGRVGSIVDVMIDTIGSSIGVLLYKLGINIRKRNRQNKTGLDI